MERSWKKDGRKIEREYIYFIGLFYIFPLLPSFFPSPFPFFVFLPLCSLSTAPPSKTGKKSPANPAPANVCGGFARKLLSIFFPSPFQPRPAPVRPFGNGLNGGFSPSPSPCCRRRSAVPGYSSPSSSSGLCFLGMYPERISLNARRWATSGGYPAAVKASASRARSSLARPSYSSRRSRIQSIGTSERRDKSHQQMQATCARIWEDAGSARIRASQTSGGTVLHFGVGMIPFYRKRGPGATVLDGRGRSA